MTPKKFIDRYGEAAKFIEQEWEIPAIVTLAQAALESGWGTKAPGFNFFGYTAPNSYTGQRQLLKTTEYHSTSNIWYPVIIKVTKVAANKYQYLVRRYFKCYSNAEQSFEDYARLISTDKYASAFDYQDDPARFFAVIFNAGYATSSSYYQLVNSIMQTIKKLI